MRSQKNRSPSYPVLSLKEAVEHVLSLYERDRFRDVTYDEIAARWGYSPSSSNVQRLMAGLKQFGLVEENKFSNSRTIRLSHLGKRIALGSHTESNDFRSALEEALLNPPVYKKLWTKWKDDIPANEEITRYLILELDFNPQSVDSFLHNYLDSLRYVQQHTVTTDKSSIEPEQNRKPDHHQPSEKKVSRPVSNHVETDALPQTLESEKRVLNIPLVLLDGGQATLSFTIPLSEQDFNLLTSLIEANLQVMKPAIVIPARKQKTTSD